MVREYPFLFLDQKLSVSGLFWAPKDQDKVLRGTLSYDGNGHISLETEGLFSSRGSENTAATIPVCSRKIKNSITYLYGMVSGTPVTLLGQLGVPLPSGNIMHTHGIYRFENVVVGSHLPCTDSVEIESLSFSVDGLQEMCAAVTDTDYDEDQEAPFHFIDPKKNTLLFLRTSSDPESEKYFEVVFDVPTDLETALKAVFEFSTLISFSINRMTGLRWVKFKCAHNTESGTGNFDNNFSHLIFHPWKIGYSSTATSQSVTPFLNFNDVPFKELIEAWFSLYRSHSASVGTFLMLHYSSNAYIEMQIPVIAMSLEALHSSRKLNQEKFSNKEEFDAELRKLKDCVSTEYRKFFSEVFVNRRSFAERLTDLIETLDSGTKEALCINFERWINDFKRVRNSIIHTGIHTGSSSESNPERLYPLLRISKCIQIALFLHILNLPQHLIEEIIKSNSYFKETQNLIQEHYQDLLNHKSDSTCYDLPI